MLFKKSNTMISIKNCMFLLLISISSPAFSQVTVLITYHSETGNTAQMAEAVSEGVALVDGVDVYVKMVSDIKTEDLLNADAIIVGSPVYNANVSPEVSRFIAKWPFEGEPLKDKIGAAFVTGGGISAGEEIVQMNILQSMLVFGMIIVGGPDWTQPFGASAITREWPSQNNTVDSLFLEKGRTLGRRVAQIAVKMSSK